MNTMVGASGLDSRAGGVNGVSHMKVVPSTDPNITMALALSVFVMILYYSIKCKGSRVPQGIDPASLPLHFCYTG